MSATDIPTQLTPLHGYRTMPPLATAKSVAAEHAGASVAAGTVAAPRMWLLGTGMTNVSSQRSGPANFVDFGSARILVDCGVGTTQRLFSLGVDPASVTHIAITHHHIDHNCELPALLIAPWADRTRTAAPVVIGPPGTKEFVDRLLYAFDYDLRTRVTMGFGTETVRPNVLEVEDGLQFGANTWTCTAFRVDHSPVDQAFGYRFDWDNGSLAISGDTSVCQNLIDRCSGVDVLVHEALFPGYGFPEYHTTVDQVGAVATAAEAGYLVLTHLIPGHIPDQVWRHRVAQHYTGPITVGTDLLQIF